MTHGQYVEAACVEAALQLALARTNHQNTKHSRLQFARLLDEFKHIAKVDTRSFNFSAWVHKGESLFVGEGNLSFSLTLARLNLNAAHQITATTYEKLRSINIVTAKNANVLTKSGCVIKHGIDATSLSNFFAPKSKALIVFQFPHAGSRSPKEGHNPNYILLCDFLNLLGHVSWIPDVAVSTVDTPHYKGAFQFEMAVKKSGFEISAIRRFYPSQFRGYTHVNTNDDDSALAHHNKYCTWVFKKQ